MKTRKRVSYNLKPETIELVRKASEIFNEDMSKIVDDCLQFRLGYINKEENRTKAKLTKEQKNLLKEFQVKDNEISKFFEWYNKQDQTKAKNELFTNWYWYNVKS